MAAQRNDALVQEQGEDSQQAASGPPDFEVPGQVADILEVLSSGGVASAAGTRAGATESGTLNQADEEAMNELLLESVVESVLESEAAQGPLELQIPHIEEVRHQEHLVEPAFPNAQLGMPVQLSQEAEPPVAAVRPSRKAKRERHSREPASSNGELGRSDESAQAADAAQPCSKARRQRGSAEVTLPGAEPRMPEPSAQLANEEQPAAAPEATPLQPQARFRRVTVESASPTTAHLRMQQENRAMTLGQFSNQPPTALSTISSGKEAEKEVEQTTSGHQAWLSAAFFAAALAASGLAWLVGKLYGAWTGWDVTLSCTYVAFVAGVFAVCLGQLLRPQWQLRLPPLLLTCAIPALAVLEAKSQLDCGQPPAATWRALCVQAALLQCLAVLLPGACGRLLAAGIVTVTLAVVMALEGQLLAREIIQCLLLPATAMCTAAWLTSTETVMPGQGMRQQLRVLLRDFVIGRKVPDKDQLLNQALVDLVPMRTPSTKAAMVELLEVVRVKLRCADLPPPLKNSLGLLVKKLLKAINKPLTLIPLIPQSLLTEPAEVQDYIMDLIPGIVPSRHTNDSGDSKLQMAPRSGTAARSFDQHMAALLQPLCHVELHIHALTNSETARAQGQLAAGLGQWGFDIFSLAEASGERPLHLVGQAALQGLMVQLELDCGVLLRFLQVVESRYRSSNAYHNSMHAADVLNSMVYFFGLQSSNLPRLPPLERLAALTAATCHDVGHDGVSNRFHVTVETPLAQLFNDQSCLENMHAAIAVALLKGEGTNFLEPLPTQEWSAFRSNVVTMILDTDLGKHFASMAAFTKDFLEGTPSMENPKHRQQLLSMVLKSCDVGGSAKTFALHARWATLINTEFFRQGDHEKELGFPPSPFCDRLAQNVADSQKGFYKFIALPLFTALNDHLQSRRLALEVLEEAKANQKFWEDFDSATFNYEDPVANVPMLVRMCTSAQLDARASERQNLPAPPPLQMPPRFNTVNHGEVLS